MSIVRGTTPTLSCTFGDGIDLTTFESVYVTIRQGSTVITKTGNSLSVTARQVDCWLSQEETLSLTTGAAEVQVNWTVGDGNRGCSTIQPITLGRQLLTEVLE